MSCIFCRIVNSEIPAQVVYQDEQVMAFRDIHPKAPVHVLVIPKAHRESLSELEDAGDLALAGRLLLAVKKVADLTGIAAKGYRVISNVRDHGGQEVAHLHFHVVGGRKIGAMLPAP